MASAEFRIARVIDAVAYNGGYLASCPVGMDFDLDGEMDTPLEHTREGIISPPLGQFRVQTMRTEWPTIILRTDGACVDACASTFVPALLWVPPLKSISVPFGPSAGPLSDNCRDTSTDLRPGYSMSTTMDAKFLNPLTTNMVWLVRILSVRRGHTLLSRVQAEVAIQVGRSLPWVSPPLSLFSQFTDCVSHTWGTQRLHGIHPNNLLCCTDAWELSRNNDPRGILMMTRIAQLDVFISAGSVALYAASNGSLPSLESAAVSLWEAIGLKAQRLRASDVSLNDPALTVSERFCFSIASFG